MKLFRLRFIILGLLLCVFHVWCRTCGTDLIDPESSAYLAGVVVDGLVVQPLPSSDGKFNVTVKIRSVYKGISKKKKGRSITIGEFGQEIDPEKCITNIQRGNTRYLFFLNKTEQNYYTISAFPEKYTKKIGRKIRKILCKKAVCGKPPILRKIKVRKFKVGRPIQLKCRIKSSKPDAVFRWQKDGQDIQSRGGVRIKSARKNSRLKINKAKLSDAGTYTCIATNIYDTVQEDAKVTVLPPKPKPSRNSTRKPVTEVSRPPQYVACPPEKKGYCLNNGECRMIVSMQFAKCQCPETHNGDRCQYRSPIIFPYSEGAQARQKDRTLTIIGIVIGILVFVCICIASYFLAKRRREQFLRRQEDKKRKNSKSDSQKYIPTSYRLLNSLDDVDGSAPKIKSLSSVSTTNMETQTEETSFMPTNPNTNVRLYLNPMNNFPQHQINPAQGNSRNRLSAVSVDGKSSNRTSSGSGILPSAQGDTSSPRTPKNKTIPPESKPGPSKPKTRFDFPPSYERVAATAPKLRMDSGGGASSEEEDPANSEMLTPLHISEGEDERSLNSPTYGGIAFPHEKRFFNSLGKAAPSRRTEAKVDVPIYVNANGMGSNSSLTSSDSSLTGSADSEVSAVYRMPCQLTKDYPDSISWNERGSPEHIIGDKDCSLPIENNKIQYLDKSYSPNNKKFAQSRSGCSDMQQEKRNKMRNVVVSEPSVPV